MGCDRYRNDPALVGPVSLTETGLNKLFAFCFIHKLSTGIACNYRIIKQIFIEET